MKDSYIIELDIFRIYDVSACVDIPIIHCWLVLIWIESETCFANKISFVLKLSRAWALCHRKWLNLRRAFQQDSPKGTIAVMVSLLFHI